MKVPSNNEYNLKVLQVNLIPLLEAPHGRSSRIDLLDVIFRMFAD